MKTASFAIIFLMLAAPAGAQLVTNGTFDTTVDDWEPFWDGTHVWDPLDVAGSESSGSCLITTNSTSAGNATGPYQCVSGIVGGQEYLAQASVFFPGSQPEPGWTRMFVRWFSDFCFGDQISTFLTPNVDAPDVWSTTRRFVEAPANAVVAAVRIDVWKVNDTGSLSAYFDNVHLDEVVFHDGFENGDFGSWSSATP